jgi:hypothetical protein
MTIPEPKEVASAILIELRDYVQCFGYFRSIAFVLTYAPEASVVFPEGAGIIIDIRHPHPKKKEFGCPDPSP